MEHTYQEGDKVRLLGNPYNLPDNNGVGSFHYSGDLYMEYTIRKIAEHGRWVRLEEDYDGWCWDLAWIEPARTIFIGGE